MPFVQTFPEFLGWCRRYLSDGRRPRTRDDLRIVFRQGGYDACGLCPGCDRAVVFRDRAVGRSRNTSRPDMGCWECGNCRGCCDCVVCVSCREVIDSRMESICGDCERCSSCCECRFCEGCNRNCTDDTCGECGYCRARCCECSSGECRVELFENDLTFHPAKRNELKENPSRRYVSAEIEIDNVDEDAGIARVVNKWRGSIVEDGSLSDSGFEINTAPASGDKWVEQITEICKRLAASGASVTAACGLHVHIDARDLDYYAIRRLIRVYAAIEPALFDMCSPSRRTSRYCVPCGETYLHAAHVNVLGAVGYKDAKDRITSAVYNLRAVDRYSADRLKALKDQKYFEGRYHALNLHSWFHRGTVECRMFNGTANADKIVSWGMLWAQILDFCAARTEKDVGAELHGTPYEILQRIARLPRLQAFVDERTRTHTGREPGKEAA